MRLITVTPWHSDFTTVVSDLTARLRRPRSNTAAGADASTADTRAGLQAYDCTKRSIPAAARIQTLGRLSDVTLLLPVSRISVRCEYLIELSQSRLWSTHSADRRRMSANPSSC